MAEAIHKRFFSADLSSGGELANQSTNYGEE